MRRSLLCLVFALVMGVPLAGAATTETPVFDTMWGGPGSGDGQFQAPAAVAVDRAGNIYVADTNNNRIQKFDANGTFLTKWGSEGSADGQFQGPSGIAADSSGNVYVADTFNSRIQKFDANGTFLTKWGGFGIGEGEFRFPLGLAVDTAGNVYVGDRSPHEGAQLDRIQKFSADGSFLMSWGSSGSGDGQFQSPSGIAVDADGSVYVADTHNQRIQKFDANGTFLTKWGSFGTGDGEFAFPAKVAVDALGNVYVADFHNSRIQKFDSSGSFLTKWGSEGSVAGEFQGAAAVAVDAVANVYVADAGNNRIQKFKDATPPVVSCSASPGSLWPPNHKLRGVSTSVTVSDGGSGPAGFTLVQVTSNEPDDGLGDGDTANDIQGWQPGTPDTTGLLRAERSALGSGRVYTLTYEGADGAGNRARCTATVAVP
jgi:DNA-binding beta-propeller fold protein YncE